jgi:diguanylate cyclase (GGDEF)-like protein
MSATDKKVEHRQSLRFKYLVVAALVASLLIGGSFVANLYVRNVTGSNAEALQLHDSVTGIIGDIRNSIWQADTALNAMLISPRTVHQKTIKDSLQIANDRLRSLTVDQTIDSAGIASTISQLNIDFAALKENVYELMERRKDPNWVYPMLPFISSTLRESYMEFESSAEIALNEIAENDGETHATELYRRIDAIRDLWRLKIMNFREAIIRFAGLNQLDPVAQERNIDYIHKQIQAKLAELDAFRDQGLLGFETEAALEIMKYRSTKWHENFLELKKLRTSKIWRADIHFLELNVRPHQERVFHDLADLEKRVSDWSSRNASAVEQAATKINVELWGLSGLALAFVVIVYLMIDRSVLRPVARIVSAISEESDGIERLSLPHKSSKEIYALINAFNTMRRQVLNRQLALEHQALHDSLTGLPNRALLLDRLAHGIHAAHRDGSKLAIMLLDLDRFKEINDTLGHHVGDRVLQNISKRLASTVRESDTVSRLGGDEFAIIIPGTDAKRSIAFVNKIVDTIDEVINIESQNLYVSVSVGIAVYPDHGTDATTLIRHADIAMYSAKQGNMDYALFEEKMDKHSVDNLALLGDLRNEMERQTGQFRLHYQPKINLQTNEILGVEALLRWEHPKLGYIPPDQIIRMAEQSGLIGSVTVRVLEQAITDCAAWQHDGIDASVAVNLSAWNLQDPELPRLVASLLSQHELDAKQLTLEITESAVMSDPIRAGEVLHELSEMGIYLAIDDYGTGFSSLAYLKLLPVNALKIDKSFVIDMLDDENDSIIVRSTIDLAHNLGLQVIAEGVEKQQALLRLTNLKCDAAQGFYFSRPIPEAEFRTWYENYGKQEAVR